MIVPKEEQEIIKLDVYKLLYDLVKEWNNTTQVFYATAKQLRDQTKTVQRMEEKLDIVIKQLIKEREEKIKLGSGGE